MDYIKHKQYVYSDGWLSLLETAGRALFGKCWGGVPLVPGWGAVLDASRLVYNTLWTDFIELTAECAKLWDEVRTMRSLISAWKVDQTRQAKRIDELCEWQERAKEREAEYKEQLDRAQRNCEVFETRWRVAVGLYDNAQERIKKMQADVMRYSGTPMYIQPKVALRLDDYGRVVRAVDQFGTVLDEYKLPPMPPFDKALAENKQLRQDLEGVQKLYRAANEEIAALRMKHPAPAPVVYGVDFGSDDKALVIVRQGNKVLHVIDIAAERKKKNFSASPVWPKGRMIFPQKFTWHGPSMNLHNLTKSYGDSNWALRRAAYDAGQRTRQLNGCIVNHQKPWTPAMDEELMDRYRRGFALYTLAIKTGREWEAVLYRLAHLCRWPKQWLRPENHEKFLRLAWTWFFASSGSPWPTGWKRLNQIRFVPAVFP